MICGQSVPPNVPTNGLVAYYGFNGNANDLSGNYNHGYVRGATLTSDRFGNPNSAYYFGGRGSNNYIRVNQDNSLNLYNTVSISFWMMQTSSAGTIWNNNGWSGYEQNVGSDAIFTVIAKSGLSYGYSNYGGLCVYTSLSSSRQQLCDLKISDRNGNHLNVGAQASMNCYTYGQWIHVVQVVDGNRSRVYFNGVLYTELTTAAPSLYMSNNFDLYIGQQDDPSPYFTFNGSLDDIAIYNRALSDSEVRSLFNNYRDPYDNENHIDIDNISIQQPCGADAGSITINPRPNAGASYAYAFTSPNSPQASNVLSAGPGTHRVYVVSQCAVLDTLVTISCCNTVPEYEDIDSMCVGDHGQIGSSDEVILLEGFTNSYDVGTWIVDESNTIGNGSSRTTRWAMYQYDLNGTQYNSGAYRNAYGGSGRSAMHLTWWGNNSPRTYSSTLRSPAIYIPYNPMLVYVSFAYVAIAFNYSNGEQGYNNLSLEYSTSPSGPWTEIWSSGGGDVDPDTYPYWAETAFSLSNLPGPGTYYFRFKSAGNGYMTGVDDFKVSANTIRTVPSELEHSVSGDRITVRMPWTVPGRCDVQRLTTWIVYDSSSSDTTVNSLTPYRWTNGTGQTYATPGTYSYNNNGRLKNRHGCDSTARLHLIMQRDTRVVQTINACNSYTWPVNGQTYTVSTLDSVTCTACNQYGNDSTTVLQLTINHSSTPVSESINQCNNYTRQIGSRSRTFSASTEFDTIITNRAGCDSSIHLSLTINQNTTATPIEVGSCNDYTWSFNGQRYTSSGTYTHTITGGNRQGCDSTATIILSISSSINVSINKDTCDHYLWTSTGIDYTTSGNYSSQTTTPQGCDSTTTLHLTLHNTARLDTAISICDSLLWLGATLSTSGNYHDTLSTAHHCDSITTLILTVRHSTHADSINERHCDEYTWPFNGQRLTVSGTFSHTNTAANSQGCDSTQTLILVIDSSTSQQFTIDTCDSYLWNADNNTYSASGQYSSHHNTIHGCDSLLTLNLTLHFSAIADTQYLAPCDSLLWHASTDTLLTSSGIYSDTIATTHLCDSIITLNLTVRHSTNAGTISLRYCDEYTWPLSGQRYTASGEYNHTQTGGNSQGCDSTLTLRLTIDSSQQTTVSIDTCDNYLWETTNIYYTRSGSFNAHDTTTHGCDSTITLQLTIRYSSQPDTLVVDSCDTYTWHISSPRTFSQSGIYSDTNMNIDRCDSINILNLSIRHSTTAPTIQQQPCDSFYWDATAITYTDDGLYSHTLTNLAGCDSNVSLNLTLRRSSVADTQHTVNCNSYIWPANWQTYSSNGIYLDTSLNHAGCDSVRILSLSIVTTPSLTLSSDTTIYSCSYALLSASGADDYSWYPRAPIRDTLAYGNVMTIRAQLTHDEMFVVTGYRLDNNGNRLCSSTNNIRVYVIVDTAQHTACDNYTWATTNSARTYTTSGIFTDTITTDNGCDSIVRLRLTINKSIHLTETIDSCDRFLWHCNNNIYTASTIDTLRLRTQHDCDSLRILRLTLRYSSPTDTTHAETCNEYRWPFDNHLYKRTTDTIVHRTNQVGCDSNKVLNLIIHRSSLNIVASTTCDSFFFPPTATTYNQSIIDTINATSIYGCDSITILRLTIHYSDTLHFTDTTCSNHPYNFANRDYSVSGNYSTTLRKQNDCDSVLSLHLTVFPAYELQIFDTVAEDSIPYHAPDGSLIYYAFRDNLYSLSSSHQCDSLIHLNLFVRYKMIDCDGTLAFPNLVTPNGDGVNDTYSIVGLERGCWPHNDFRILNRWGAIVFHATDMTDGNDCWKPDNMPAGTYFYIFIGSNPQQNIHRQGVIEVVK